MSVELVTGTFEPHVGETFAATPSHAGEPLELVLKSCDESPHARPDHPAFSLTFDSPEPEVREQQIFALEHADLGQFDLFLVPIARTESGGIAYEAVIN
jgi:hypothetical protein